MSNKSGRSESVASKTQGQTEASDVEEKSSRSSSVPKDESESEEEPDAQPLELEIQKSSEQASPVKMEPKHVADPPKRAIV